MPQEDSQRYFNSRFNTALDAENEQRFQNWLTQTKTKYGNDLSGDLDTYDLRGFWLNGGHADEAFRRRAGHAPDTYKKPNHPTFSDQSIYHGSPSEYGGKYVGGTWQDDSTFVPSDYMLSHTHPQDWYMNWMKQYGEGVRLVLPKEK
jgi:hypothetical protein